MREIEEYLLHFIFRDVSVELHPVILYIMHFIDVHFRYAPLADLQRKCNSLWTFSKN